MDPLLGRFHSVWDHPDGRRLFFDVPAQVELAPDETAVVHYTVTLASGFKEARRVVVDRADVHAAQVHLERKRVSVALPNGGLLNGVAQEIAVFSENGQVQVGLEIEHSDLIPSRDMSRRYATIRSFHPVSRVRFPAVGDPLDVPLMEQRLLLGSTQQDWNATPVVVLGRRTANMGPSYFVMEKRDLVDPTIRLARIYLVPMEWLRASHDSKQYQDLLEASLLSNQWKRDTNYTGFRHQGLASWTHAVFYFDEDPTSFETEDERFERRAAQLLKWFNGLPRADEGRSLVTKTRNCADYLYLPEDK